LWQRSLIWSDVTIVVSYVRVLLQCLVDALLHHFCCRHTLPGQVAILLLSQRWAQLSSPRPGQSHSAPVAAILAPRTPRTVPSGLDCHPVRTRTVGSPSGMGPDRAPLPRTVSVAELKPRLRFWPRCDCLSALSGCRPRETAPAGRKAGIVSRHMHRALAISTRCARAGAD
jgi:hypothetical protein